MAVECGITGFYDSQFKKLINYLLESGAFSTVVLALRVCLIAIRFPLSLINCEKLKGSRYPYIEGPANEASLVGTEVHEFP